MLRQRIFQHISNNMYPVVCVMLRYFVHFVTRMDHQIVDTDECPLCSALSTANRCAIILYSVIQEFN